MLTAGQGEVMILSMERSKTVFPGRPSRMMEVIARVSEKLVRLEALAARPCVAALGERKSMVGVLMLYHAVQEP